MAAAAQAAEALARVSAATDLATLRWGAAEVDRLLPAALQPQAVGLRVTLGWLAMATVHHGAMRALVQAMVAPDRPEPAESVLLGWMLSLMARVQPDAALRACLERAAQQAPGHPIVQMERAQWALLDGEAPARVLPWLLGTDPAADGYPIAMAWAANTAFRLGQAAVAVDCFERARAVAPLHPDDEVRLAHLRVREAGQAATPAAPAATVDADAGPFEGLGAHPLRPALATLEALLRPQPVFDAPWAPEAQADAWAESARTLPAACARLTWTLEDVQSLAEALRGLAQTVFLEHARWAMAHPMPLGPEVGRWDPRRCTVQWRGLWAQVQSLAAWVLSLDAPLQGAPHRGHLRAWFELLQLGLEACSLLDEPAAAAALRARADAVLAPTMGAPVRALLAERGALDRGDLDAARAARAHLATDATATAEVVALPDWADWLAASGWTPEPLLAGTTTRGSTAMISPEGGWATHEAATPPEALHWVRADGVEVRQSHALQTPAAGLLMPNPWYRGMGEFPYAHAEVLNRGRRAATLRRPAAWRTVTEPVLALANMDALEHRNYYHWMLLTLSRAVLADQAGLLTDRRLLVPAECSPWMLESLALAGLGPERCLSYGRDEALRLSDARVVSPALLPSPGLVAPLRARLWAAAGLDPAQPPRPHRALYLTRQGENRRPLVEEAALAARAQALGFEVVAPETLSLTEQVRLFARARAVVGASGAALTNLMWMQPGARVVVITKEETAAPFWPDLARCNGLSLSWLTGRSPSAYRWAHLTNSPFSVRLDVAETALQWALDDTRPA